MVESTKFYQSLEIKKDINGAKVVDSPWYQNRICIWNAWKAQLKREEIKENKPNLIEKKEKISGGNNELLLLKFILLPICLKMLF